MVAATVAFAAPKSGKKSVRKAKNENGRQDACPTDGTRSVPTTMKQPWMPSDKERTIFQWVKFEGLSQSEVAYQFRINQSTVSRIVKRYERWIARGGDEQEGAPSYEERLRSQRWLTYERNEWILCSALRIAAQMEREYQTTKSKTAGDSFIHQREVSYEHKTIDRTGIAARFLRLAYRINMDQLRLVEAGPLPALEPFSLEEAGQASVADRAEMQAAEEKAEREAEEESGDRSQESVASDHSRFTTDHSQQQMTNDQGPMTDDGVHKTHNYAGCETDLSADEATDCGENGRPKKSDAYAYSTEDGANCNCLAPASTPGIAPPGHHRTPMVSGG